MENITSKTYDDIIYKHGQEIHKDVYYRLKKIEDKRRVFYVLKYLAPSIGEVVLDVGCGVGTFAYHSAKEGAKSVGLDYSFESVKLASILKADFDAACSAYFTRGDAMQMPFLDKVFDKAVAADFIEHITNKEKRFLLSELKRVVKPGGRIIIFTPNKIREDIATFYWTIRHFLFKDKIPVNNLHYGLIDKSGFEKILKDLNFSFRFYYLDVTRPYIAKIPFLRRFLSLNLLWAIEL